MVRSRKGFFYVKKIFNLYGRIIYLSLSIGGRLSMRIKEDLSDFRRCIMSDKQENISSELKIFDNRKCTFYYDESNNLRKLRLDKDNFHENVGSDFVLGGVMYFGDKPSADVDLLKKQVRLQKSAKEMKFKHLSKAKSFLDCLRDDRVIYFLQWLIDSDLYVHCANVNHLYYTVVDIIDSIDEQVYMPFVRRMKNELYKLIRRHYQDFYMLLMNIGYPNIAPEDISKFYDHILAYIEEDYTELPLDVEILREGLKAARKQGELLFLQGNTEKTIIDNYFSFYLRPIGVFLHADHIFDNENSIQEQFAKYELYNGNTRVKNFSFVDSKNSPLTQVSDCVVGLYRKYYAYINSIHICQAQHMLETISDEQRNALHLFVKLFYKSENISKLLFNSCESIEEHDIGAFILHNV